MKRHDGSRHETEDGTEQNEETIAVKTNQITPTLLAAVLLVGTGNLLLGQDTTATCPLGNQPGYPGAGVGRGQGLRAGQGLGQCQRLGQCDGTGPQNRGNACPFGQAGQVTGEITTADANHILFMKQEEKLARDVYQALAEKWEHPTFVHIADLDEALAATQNATVFRVFTNLRRGSANHLAAFNRAIAALDAPGTATAGPAGKGPGARQGGKAQPGTGARMRGGR